LDGVRALAVIAVLLFHGGVSQLAGGFLGVDAFFVLSGFLITSLLLAEHARHHRIRLAAFWARRARRLLPALLVVLVVVIVAAPRLISGEEVGLLRGDALATLLYVANWRMIYRGDDYFTQTATPSALQHAWSLGIEEQFYVLWPLIVVAILIIMRRKAFGTLLAVCLLGFAASVVAAAVFFEPLDSNRAYFGTDTRAQALLIGCALAVVLSRRRPAVPATHARPTRRFNVGRAALTLAATAAVGGIGWLWVNADGTAAWLYHGGLAGGAIAVAIVLAHAVLNPDAAIGRLLALPPLVWVGKISYGLYLWHWPLFQFLNAERTGLHGPQLLAVRLVATLAISTVSFALIEQPIRMRRWPRGLPRLRPVYAGLGTFAVVGATGALIVVATLPPKAPPAAPVIALPTVAARPGAGEQPAPILRSHRKPGTEPRIMFLGDSVSWSLATFLPPQPGLDVSERSLQGCGIARLPDMLIRNQPQTMYENCPAWDRIWRRYIAEGDPDVAVILLDRWELVDRRLGTEFRHVGQPEYNLYLAHELELAISTAGRQGAHVVLLTAPYTRRAERPDGGLYDEDLPERVDAWNQLLREVAARHPTNVTVLDLNRLVCPDGEFTWSINGLRMRTDGLHFTERGVREVIAPWLLPQVAAIAVGAEPPAVPTVVID
jgi:peptidoglycan/LPS O-acetylase OafA/YrhL